MTKTFVVVLFILLFTIGCESKTNDVTAQTPANPPSTMANESVPQEYLKGREAFNKFCAKCHGPGGTGTDRGPTFLSRIYHPNHHADPSFYRAVEQGVRAHHWNFGDMPKVDGPTKDVVTEIIGYIRWLQQKAGIF